MRKPKIQPRLVTNFTAETLKKGDKVACNGYPMTVETIHAGMLAGMVDMKGERGSVCVGISEVIRFQNEWADKPRTDWLYRRAAIQTERDHL